MTAIEMITAALRKANVIDQNEVPSAEQGIQGLETLNDLMGQFDRDGIKLGWTTVAALDDTVPLAPQDHRAVKHNLAVELAGEYGLEVLPRVQSIATETYNALAKYHMKFVESKLDHLPTPEPWATGLSWPLE